MQIDLFGRVANTELPSTQPLLPLFEAIVNSIHAIEDAGESKGEIRIPINRVAQAKITTMTEGTYNPIEGFEIIDNGIGFTEANYDSFCTSDTQYKASRGGKGVGRFLWLKAFADIQIESVFHENGKSQKRSFDFSIAGNGVVNHRLVPAGNAPVQTSIKLNNFKKPYSDRSPKNPIVVARRIIEHCLEYFVLERMPSITLVDHDDEVKLDLNKLYSEWIRSTGKTGFRIGEQNFLLTHFMLQSHSGMEHRICYCASHRVVREDKLDKQIPNLKSSLPSPENENDSLTYAGYVSSDYLDSHVNQQRTDFHTATEGGLQFVGDLAWRDIEATAISQSKLFLEPYTKPVKLEKEERVREYVQEHAPQYRHLIKHSYPELDSIPPTVSDERLEVLLFETQRLVEIRLRQRGNEILSYTRVNGAASSVDSEKIRQQYSQYLEEWNDLAKSNLAKYIVQRKTMLTMLAEYLRIRDTGKYSLEEAIHQIIFPLKATSDDIPYEDQNLWIIDEKLSYHRYLASDLPLKKLEPIVSDALERPDLIIFDKPIAAVDAEPPYSSIVIFEFKRPMRRDYTSDENPIEQVYKYVAQIRAGKVSDNHGRLVRISDATPFYCYILCDLTDKLQEQAKIANYQLTPDREGFFGYNSQYGAYVEIISYDKLVQDARRRNRILFDILNIKNEL